MRHFLSVADLTSDEFRAILKRGSEFRKQFESGETEALFPRKVLAMIFEKSSTRTRVSFEAGMTQLGGHAMYLSPNDTQLGRGEPLEDTARVLSQMVDMVMIRTYSHESVQKFCSASTIPVINGLTDLFHPCQLLADMQTYFDYRGDIKGKTVAWIGDGNNVCNSFINTAKLLNFNLRVASPPDYGPNQSVLDNAKDAVSLCASTKEAVDGADLVVTDVWSSMGQESESNKRTIDFANYRVTKELMGLAAKDALFMHCLPAHRGEEVDADVLDGDQSVIWDEAGNRLHAQKALIEFLFKQASS